MWESEPFVTPAMRNNSNLDILRALAVLCVLCTHFIETTRQCFDCADITAGFDWFKIGQAGVLMQSMNRMDAAGGTLAFSFYIRRIFRLYPLSILLILCCIAFKIAPNPFSNADRRFTATAAA